MRKPKYQLTLLYIIITLTVLVSGCNSNNIVDSDVRINIRANQHGQIARVYKTFTGYVSENLKSEVGKTISFAYEATVIEGRLIIEWQDPNGAVIWRQILEGSERGNVDIVIKSPGIYRIVIQGKEASGNFRVSWDIG